MKKSRLRQNGYSQSEFPLFGRTPALPKPSNCIGTPAKTVLSGYVPSIFVKSKSTKRSSARGYITLTALPAC
jgi:hypothetical protein